MYTMYILYTMYLTYTMYILYTMYMKDKIYAIVWQIMADHYFEGSVSDEDDREYATEKTNEIMKVLGVK